MKCPKCSYISFDYNQICPKCSKDISAEQAKLNLPAFRPETPSLLGALTGEADEGGPGIQMDAAGGMDTGETGMDVAIEDSGAFDPDEATFEDSQDIGLNLESGTGEISAFDLEDMESPNAEPEISPEDSVTDFDLEAEEEVSSKEPGDFYLESAEAEGVASTEESGPEEEELGIDLDSLALEGEDRGPEADLAGATPDEEVSLNLDDLKIDETGGLSVAEEAEVRREEEKPLEADEIPLEEPSPEMEEAGEIEAEDEEIDIDLDAISRDVEGTAGAPLDKEDLSLDLDDLDIELDLDEPDQKPS